MRADLQPLGGSETATRTGSAPPIASEAGDSVSRLTVSVELAPDRCVLRLRGRLCADTVALLNSHVDQLGCRSCDDVVIDISRLHMVDAVGARLIVGLTHYVAGRGGRLSLHGATASAARLIAEAELEISE